MSHDDHTDLDATPEIPDLPAPPTVTPGHRPRTLPTSRRLPAAAHDRAPQPSGRRGPAARTAEGPARSPR
jgi:hypothetical protein